MTSFIQGDALTSAEIATARHHTYTLLSRLFLEGVSAEIMPYIEAIPDLALYVNQVDDLAAVHHEIFRFDIFPYESMFCDTTGLVGGQITAAVAAAWHESGLTPPSEPDHIGNEFALLAFLAGAEADAWVDGIPLVARQMRMKQHPLLVEHVLTWLPPLVTSLYINGHPFYMVLADLTWDIVADHMATLVPSFVTVDDLLPHVPDLLSDERTGVKDIVRFLTTPAHSGIWFGRNAIIKAGRESNLPRGFGGRIDMAMALFRSAIAYGEVEALLSSIGTLATEWSTHYKALQARASHLNPYIVLWEQRAQNTAMLVESMLRFVKPDTLDGNP